MATRSDWAGSVLFAGFPISFRAYKRVRDRRSEAGFKMLDPKFHAPVKQAWLDQEGTLIQRADTVKGVEANGGFHVLPNEALELIEAQGRSTSIEIKEFSPRETVDFSLALTSFVLTPDEKVAGSEGPVNILWNGLRATGRVAVIEGWAQKGNSKPSTLVIDATENGLIGYVEPFRAEVNPVPTWTPTPDEKQASVFSAFAEQNYTIADFSLDDFTDTKNERHAAAIAMAISGEASVPEELTAPAPAVPDLMAALEASLAANAGANVGTKPKKAVPKKKVAA